MTTDITTGTPTILFYLELQKYFFKKHKIRLTDADCRAIIAEVAIFIVAKLPREV